MNKKLQSMYKSGGLLKALLKDPAQAKMARQMLGSAAEGMAVNKTKLGMPGTAVPGAKNTYGGGGVMKYRMGGKAMYANGGQNGPPSKSVQDMYAAFAEIGVDPRVAAPGSFVNVKSEGQVPSTAQQIARHVRSGQETFTLPSGQPARGMPEGDYMYTSVVPTIDHFLKAVSQEYNLDPNTLGGMDMTAEQVLKQAFGMADGTGYSSGSPGHQEFDRILGLAADMSANEYAKAMENAQQAQRKSANQIRRKPGETDEQFRERIDRNRYRPEMKMFNIEQALGDRLLQNQYHGLGADFDAAYDQARYANESAMRDAVINLLNEYAGSDVYSQFSTQPKYHSGYTNRNTGPN